MASIRILLADDDAVFCRLVGDLLEQNGYEVALAYDSEGAHQALQHSEFDIMMQDLCFPSLRDGFTMLEDVREKYPRVTILMISGEGHIPDVVRAIRQGAADFIEKPIEPEHLLLRIRNLSENLLQARQISHLEQAAIGMVGVSEEMRKVFEDISAAAKYDIPVLVTGETGVGKELAIHAIHRLSRFGTNDLVSINCASVPHDLFEAELFGYEKGAFTGAVSSYKGYFEYAQNTSFFLDEIGELPQNVQAKLLRALSEGEIQRIGGKVSRSHTRILSASNQDLQAAVRNGSFREDLLYRLDTIHIHIPPLRHRVADIAPLARHFVADFCQRNNLPLKEISSRALDWMNSRKWLGNARELKNCVERAVIFTTGDVLGEQDLAAQRDDALLDEACQASLREQLKLCEARIIKQSLQANNFNLTRASRDLGMDKSNLSKRIHALGLGLYPME
ncbi:MAG: sigma-54-dependent Fis family transcriptional regulator [Candidatus Cloacimonetes bacterium]|nr:sigma-54-dependent Fis family transcriptional regulator [Candidatus Cloacimonadota bacterium]